jgi:hypothetical protein
MDHTSASMKRPSRLDLARIQRVLIKVQNLA